jgi:hypothetical protein
MFVALLASSKEPKVPCSWLSKCSKRGKRMEYVRRAEGLGYAASKASITSMIVVLLVRCGAIFSSCMLSRWPCK